MIRVQPAIRIVPRTELVLLQYAQCLELLVPSTAARALPLLEQAFHHDAFERLTFYLRNPERLTFAALAVELDGDRHREFLDVCPETELDPSWTNGLAPDLRAATRYFLGLARKTGSQILPRLTVNPRLWPHDLEPAPPVRWLPTRRKSESHPVTSLEECRYTVELSENP